MAFCQIMKLLFFGGFIPPMTRVLGMFWVNPTLPSSTPGEFLKPEAADVHHGRILVRNMAWLYVTLW